MKSINRIFSIAVAVVLMCANAIAQVTPPQDSDDYYRLSTQQDVVWFANATYDNPQLNARLLNDITIDFTEGYTGPRLFSANPENPYGGTFDGNNYTIHLNNLELTQYADYVGLFRYAAECTIKNLRIDGVLTTSSQYCASLVGKATGFVTIDKCISSVRFDSNYAGDNKVYAGFIAKVDNGGNHFSIKNSAFRGRTNELVASNGAKLCGLVGESSASSSGSGEIVNSYVYCTKVGILTENAVLYPIGDVTDNKNYLSISKFYVLEPGVSADKLASYSSLSFSFASAKGFAGTLESDELQVVNESYMLYDDYDQLAQNNALGDRNFESRPVKVGRVWVDMPYTYDLVDGEYVLNEDDEGNYVKELISSVDYNVYKFLDNTVWSKGDVYPLMLIKESYVDGKTTFTWNSVSWTGGTPTASNNVRIKAGQTVTLNSSANCRDIYVENGAKLILTGSSDCNANVLNILSGGSVEVKGTSSLDLFGSVNVADDAELKLVYSPTTDSPSLHYEGDFNGQATIERTFYPTYMTHVGSSIKEHTYANFTNWAMASYFNVNTGWAAPYYIDERLGGGEFPGDITTARVIGIATDEEKVGEQQYVMTEKGTPASAVDVFEVSTSSPVDGYCTYNNPYPYTVDVTGFEHGGTVAWKECTGAGYHIKTYNKESGYVTNDKVNESKKPFVAPFKTVTYQITDRSESFVLPSKKASEASYSKSEKVIDCIALQLYVDNSSEPSDEFALVYSANGSLETDITVDSPVARCTLQDDKGNFYQASSQIIVRKPDSEQDLAVAIVPLMADILDETIPFYVVAPNSGVQTLKISAPNAAFYNEYYTLYLYDKATKWMQNLTIGDYIVPQVDNLFENRFLLVLVAEGDIPVISDDNTVTAIESTTGNTGLENVIVTSKDGKVIVNNVPDELIGSNIDVYNTLGVKVSSTPAEINNTLNAEGKGVRAVVINNQSKKVMVK